MIYEQRQPPEKDLRGPTPEYWVPDDMRAKTEPTYGDAYVVVDDIADEHVVLSSAPWPHLDGLGRLTFLPEPDELHARADGPLGVLQDVVNSLRGGIESDGALITRPLRIGDTFLVRGWNPIPSNWELLVDVTSSARLAAKVALYSAIAPRVTPRRAEELGLTGGEMVPSNDEPGSEQRRPPQISGPMTAGPAV